MEIELSEYRQQVKEYYNFDIQQLVDSQLDSLGRQMEADLKDKTYEAVQSDPELKSAVDNKMAEIKEQRSN